MPPSEYNDLAEVVSAIGSPGFPAALAAWMRGRVPFDMIAIMVYRGRNPPIHIHDDFRGDEARKGLTQYLAQTYLLNPFFQNHLAGVRTGVYRMRDLAPDLYMESEVYRSYEIIITEQEEIGYITKHWPRGLEEVDIAVPLEPGDTCEIGVYRSIDNGGFDPAAFEMLREMLPVIDACFRQHWQRVKLRHTSDGPTDTGWAEDAFNKFGNEVLTSREREVVVLVLRGHSSESIAAHLAISRATVKTHRKHAYEKFGISTQAELLALFIDHVRRHMPNA